MIHTGMIDSCTVASRNLSDSQLTQLRPLVAALSDWTRMDFSDCDQADYRRACRLSNLTGIGEDIATALSNGRLAEEIERQIDLLDSRDRSKFRAAFAAEISTAKDVK